ncbi:MAG: hypothetical protein C0394_03005 [Syntrophus sp. (in: bacteria)]|nr:hypothetical protein [Syntrophus sp. (in: bacteria)]
MMQGKWRPGSVCIIVIICLVLIFMGCSKQPVETLSVGKTQAAGQEMTAQTPSETKKMGKASASEQEMTAHKQSAAEKTEIRPIVEKSTAGDQRAAAQTASDTKIKPAAHAADKRALLTTYVVRKGDSLWWIAKYRDVYNDPYLWTVLYDANKKIIKDPNKIYPGMKLLIPRAGYKSADIRNARKAAGARKPYNPPARAVPPAD